MEWIQLGVDVGTTLEDASGLARYALVFLFAAIPWIEILVVVPIAIGIGLDPVLTGVAAFTGNVSTVYLLVVFHRRVAQWWSRRRGGDGDGKKRHEWGREAWDRYGLPGLSLAAPVLTGVHVAALIALTAGSSTRSVAVWMTGAIAAWTVVLVAGSVYGLSLLGLG